MLIPSPGDFHNPGIELGSPTLQAVSLPSEPPGKPRTGPPYQNSNKFLNMFRFFLEFDLIFGFGFVSAKAKALNSGLTITLTYTKASASVMA